MTTPDTLPTGKPLALVTGASSGIGLELAKQFAKHGFDLVVAAENPEITQTASELTSLGADVTPVQADLSTYEGVEQLYTETQRLGRPVEALALNAGVGSGGPFSGTQLPQEVAGVPVQGPPPGAPSQRDLP